MEAININDKVGSFFKNNIDNITLILLCVGYIFYGFATIEETGATIKEIVASGSISSIVGITIKVLFRKKGILRGMQDVKFLAKCNVYGAKKQEISPYIEKLKPFCDKKNEERVIQAQKEMLLNYAYSYDDFLNKKVPDKIAKKVARVKVFKYTPVLLTNAYDNSIDEKELLSNTTKDYQKKDNCLDTLIAFLCMIIFGYFGLTSGDINWSNIVWCGLQIVLYVTMGVIKYSNSYYFITETLRGKIERIISILEVFQNEYKQELKEVDSKSKESKEQFL